MFGLDTAGGLRAGIEMRMVTIPFAIEAYIFISTFFVKILPSFGLCMSWSPFPIPKWCSSYKLKLYEWKADKIDIFLFKVVSGAYDVSAPHAITSFFAVSSQHAPRGSRGVSFPPILHSHTPARRSRRPRRAASRPRRRTRPCSRFAWTV